MGPLDEVISREITIATGIQNLWKGRRKENQRAKKESRGGSTFVGTRHEHVITERKKEKSTQSYLEVSAHTRIPFKIIAYCFINK